MSNKNPTHILKPNIKLLVTKGNDEGKVYESNRYPFIIGRDESVDFVLSKDSNISRRHAKIFIDEEGGVWIEDLKSTNGSFVNNIRIVHKTELNSGNTIILGSTWLKFIIFDPVKNEKAEKKKEAARSTFFTESKKVEAILILDQFDSSRLANKYGDDVAMKMTETLNKISLPSFNKYKSQFNKGTGDGFLVTFKKADNCLNTALEILKKVKARNSRIKGVEKIFIRISLNYGQCTIEPNGDRHGNAVNAAFRVEGLKYRDMEKTKESITSKEFPDKNRIFITEDFFNKLDEKKRKRFKHIGDFKLKGIHGFYPVYNYT